MITGDDIFVFIVSMTGIMAVCIVALSWMKGRHRLAEISAAAEARPEAAREVAMLVHENAGLKGQIGRLEERIATLERIVTDPSERTAREIERLR